jgi:hypothetical protein
VTEEEKRARAALITNLTVLPGLGNFIHGERLAGLCQMALAGIGLALILAWFYAFMTDALTTFTWPESAGPLGELGLLGLALSLLAVAWSSWTAYRRWQEAKARASGAAR